MATFIHRPDNKIIINDEIFDLSLLNKVFPEYKLQKGMDRRKYLKGEYHYISDGIKVYHQEKIWHLGDKILSRINDLLSVRSLLENQQKEEEKEAEIFQQEQRPYQEKRKSEYPPIDDLVVAIWEYIIEERTDKTKKIQDIRNKIKLKYPKKDYK